VNGKPSPPRPGLFRRLFTPISTGAARAVVSLFVLAFLLAGASYWLSVRAVHGEVANRASVTQLCQSGNSFRADQVTLWTHLVAISTPSATLTPAQAAQRQALISAFLAYVRQVFAPRDCGGLS
jgi:hypothetical protein